MNDNREILGLFGKIKLPVLFTMENKYDSEDWSTRSLRAEKGASMLETNPAAKGLGLFLTAAIVTFGCITMLQFLEKPWFFAALVAMHGGIALFVASKRTLKRGGFSLMGYYKAEYLMLVPFLFIMFYSLAGKAGLAPPFGSAKASLTLVYALVCFAVTFWNFRHMQRDARAQRDTGSPTPSSSQLAAE